MEYVLVQFPKPRRVYVDGNESGETNNVFRIGEGTHSFDLGEPKNYTPRKIILQVKSTNPLEPVVVQFQEVQP